MKVKEGVKLHGLHASMTPVIVAVEDVWRTLKLPEPTITSGSEGYHRVGSLHYDGMALDFRTWHDDGTQFGEALRALCVGCLGQALGAGYDVVGETTHIHIEYDP